jgi:hypothetical protein
MKQPRPAHSYRGARRNRARENRWTPLPRPEGGIAFKMTWRQPVSSTDQFKGSCPILSDGTLDHRFRGVIRPNEKRRKAGWLFEGADVRR